MDGATMIERLGGVSTIARPRSAARARLVAAVGLALCAGTVLAHKPSDAYVTLERDGATLHGRFDIALRDLDNALDLDANGDADITWGEVRTRRADIAAYALPRLRISAAGGPCTLKAVDFAIDAHTDGAYVVLGLDGTCPQVASTLAIGYRLFADIDPQHRGLVKYVEHRQSRSYILGNGEPERSISAASAGAAQAFTTYLDEGVRHISTGFDHLLFLLSLLLPAVLVRRDTRWLAAQSLGASLVDVAKVVTAFTLAHSITLALAALSIIVLPARLVESGIALSVVLAALNNVFPVVAGSRWAVAFAFGLLHGFGFASALQDLGLAAGSLALSLAAFNLGVELGQLAIVLAFLPLAFALRSTWTYRRVVVGGGSLAIAAVASLWLVERAFDVGIF